MKYQRVHLIACGVLRIDMRNVAQRLGVELATTYLDGGLHSDPPELRRRLQAAIDEADRTDADIIAVGYGLCGRGTVGIWARSKPLAIPRVHDCIALFLGSDGAYRREFAKCPGTYYISAGWYEEKVQPRAATPHVEGTDGPKVRERDDARLKELADRYGQENADAILSFLNSWQRNYLRAAYIDTGAAEKKTYEGYARAMATEFNWEFERLEGSLDLLEKLLSVKTDEDDILLVPPGRTTLFDPKTRKLTSGASGAASPMGRGEKAAERRRPTDGPDAADAPTKGSPRSGRTAVEERTADGGSLGLGIDAGGTYTDVVVFDFSERQVLDKAKALTTKWDYTVGIKEGLDALDRRWFESIDLTAVSTTLATNAIVEGTGRKTGLILMPPMHTDLSEFHDPAVIIGGRMDISGEELAPVDEGEVRRAARFLVEKHGVTAFAVSGYGGSVNPEHEMLVKRLVRSETGLDVCCGHELSKLLNFRLRANTAVLNAGIIPLLEQFISDVKQSMAERGIQAPVMVVKGDGSLMSAEFAVEHPVETILSGPAASIAGARYLTEIDNTTVVDVGGTTSDIGTVRDGQVAVREFGASVGRWRTHVRAIDMHTLGLGADSEILMSRLDLHVGPRRVAPVSWLAARDNAAQAIDYVSRHRDDYREETRDAQILAITGKTANFELTANEAKVMAVLEKRPHSIAELVEKTGVGHPQLLRAERLEQSFVIQRTGLTPTDLLHVQNRMALWDRAAAYEYAEVLSSCHGYSLDEFMRLVFDLITEKLIFELVKRQLPVEDAGEDLEDTPTGKALFDALIRGGNPDFTLTARLERPVVGLGAAAEYFLREPAAHLSAELVIPPNADVANAVGAVTSLVQVDAEGDVVPASDGRYVLTGVPGHHSFADFDDAHDELVRALTRDVRETARAAGTEERRVDIQFVDRIGKSSDGTEVFLGRSVTARITGAPQLSHS